MNGSPLTVTGSASSDGANLAAASPLTISGNVNLGPYANLFTTTGNTLTLSGSVSNSSVVTDAIVVNGSGNLVLSGSLNVTGLINNSGNTPALMMGGAGNGGGNANGATTTITGGGTLSNISMGWNATANVLNLAPASPLFLTASGDPLSVGQSGGNGVINQSGGTVTVLGSTELGRWDGSYGAFNMSGGSFATLNLYSGGFGNDLGSSYFYQTGGVVTVSGSTILGASSGAGPGANTAMNVPARRQRQLQSDGREHASRQRRRPDRSGHRQRRQPRRFQRDNRRREQRDGDGNRQSRRRPAAGQCHQARYGNRHIELQRRIPAGQRQCRRDVP